MLVELVTPLILATAPTTVIVQDTEKYNHATQVAAMAPQKEELSLTLSGTRTYGGNGQPMDSDSD